MKLPHFIVYAPKVAALGGHNGITILFWTFVNIPKVSPEFVRHEYRHVWHWCIGTLAGFVLIGIACLTFHLSPLLLLASPFGFLAPYFLASAVSGYHENWFERDARRYAAEGDG